MYRYTLIAVYSSKCECAFAPSHIFIYGRMYAGISVKAYVLFYGCNPIHMWGNAVVHFCLLIYMPAYIIIHSHTWLFTRSTTYVFA